MFDTDNKYTDAIQDAQIYTGSTKKTNKQIHLVNFLLLLLLAFVAFKYLNSNTNMFLHSSSALKKQAVLGVSETIDDSQLDDAELVNILKGTPVETAKKNLPNSIQVIMNEPSIQSKASYTDEIARELDDKSGFRGKIAVVNNPNDEF